MRMNKEQQELLDEAFNQFSKYKMENFGDTRWDVIIEMNISDNTKPYFVTGRPLIKEEFIEKCKTDSEFSQRWGLKIEERELSRGFLEERQNLYFKLNPEFRLVHEDMDKHMDKHNIPTKLITIKYNDKTIESYE
jgi:lysyl-tRNA synthetase class II